MRIDLWVILTHEYKDLFSDRRRTTEGIFGNEYINWSLIQKQKKMDMLCLRYRGRVRKSLQLSLNSIPTRDMLYG